MAPVLSVVIPAHNEEDYLAEGLRCLRGQTRPPDEIVVACDACTDATSEVAVEHGARAVCVNVRSAPNARNAGAAAARGDVLLIQDADTIASPNYCEEVERAVEEGYTFGSARLVSETAHPVMRTRVWVINLWSRMAGLYVGAGIWVRRDAFQAVGGYDTSLTWGEDVELTERLSKIGRQKMIPNATLSYCERRFRDNGYLRETIERNAKMLDYIWSRRIRRRHLADRNS